MRYCYLLLALLSWPGRPVAAQVAKPPAAALFPFVEQGRWGFLDSAGAVVIKPRFAQVQAFSEGLARALDGGYYGFIDTQGQFVVPPAFDYGVSFRQGVAAMMREQKPCLINRAGNVIATSTAYQGLQWLGGASQRGLWAGWRASTGRPRQPSQGQLLAADGQLLLTDSFLSIGELHDNRLIVRQQVAAPPTKKKPAQPPHTGVLDGKGRWIIPYQRFRNISAFQEGVAIAEVLTADTTAPARQVVIDSTGQLIAHLPADQRALLFEPHARKWTVEPAESWETTAYTRYDHPAFSDGVARVRLGKAGRAPSADSCELGLIDRQGRLVARFPDFEYVSPFRNGRAWGQTAGNDWYLIDKTGRRLSVAIDEIPTMDEGPVFADGAEVVEVAKGFVALDCTGNILNQLPEPAFDYDTYQQAGTILQFNARTTDSLAWGFWNWRTSLLVPPRYTEMAAGYQHGLLAVVENHRLCYLAPDGHYVWRAAPAASAPLTLDYMRRSFYQVASAVQLPHYAGFGGWAGSNNVPTQAASSLLPANKLTLHVAATTLPNGFEPRIDGHRVSIANTTADTLIFDAQDSSLYLTVQAQDTHGQWRDIEYTPSSWCGNSYHQVYLAPGQGWQLVVPAYTGGLKTQLRLRLIRHKDDNPRKSVVLYSNAFPGSINAAQFWRQEGHVANTIMDPYSN